jgi:transposase-like protein
MNGTDRRDPQRVPLACPRCHQEHTPVVHVVAETSRRATKRPVTPECGTLLVLSLHPVSQEAIA